MRCIACNVPVDFDKEYCHDCLVVIFEYNIDLYEEDDDDYKPSTDDEYGDEV